MKMAKRALSLFLALAMMFGMVAVSASATPLGSLTNYEIDEQTNPYTSKIGLEFYRYNSDSDLYDEKITDNVVEPGEEILVMIHAQANFYLHNLNALILWQNDSFLQPLKANTRWTKFSTYEYATDATQEVYTTVFNSADFWWGWEDDTDEDGNVRWMAKNQLGVSVADVSDKGEDGSAYFFMREKLPHELRGDRLDDITTYTKDNWSKGLSNYNLYFTSTKARTPTAWLAKTYQPTIGFMLKVSDDATPGQTARIYIPEESVATGDTYLDRTRVTNTMLTWNGIKTDPSKDGDTLSPVAYYYCWYDGETSDTKFEGRPTTDRKAIKYDLSDSDKTLRIAGGGTPSTPANYESVNTAYNSAKAMYDAKVDSAYLYNDTTRTALKAAMDQYTSLDKALTSDQQATVDAVTTALNNAMNNSVKNGADYSKLSAAITTAETEAKKTSVYTASGIAAINAAIEAANAVVAANYKIDEQAKVDSAVTALNAAVEGAEKYGAANYTALTNAIAAAKALKDTKVGEKFLYTDASRNAYQAEIDKAQAVVDAAYNADKQDTVDQAVTALEAAKSLLKKNPADFSEIEAAKATVPADLDSYTTASAAKVTEAVTAADNLMKDDSLTIEDQAKVDAAAAAITKAVSELQKKASKAELAAAIAKLPTVTEECATADSWTKYQAALAEANRVNALADPSAEEIAKATSDLLAAINGVVADDCDYSELDATIATANTKVQAEYTTKSWASFKAALDAAKAVERDMKLDAAGENQDKIDEANANLVNAMNALKKAANLTALKAACDATPEFNEVSATTATWAAYQEQMAKAKKLIDDADLTIDDQPEIDQVAAALNAAREALAERARCDYSAITNASKPELEQGAYTFASWKKYADAKAAADALVAQNLYQDDAGENQKAIAAAAEAINKAVSELQLSTAAVTDVAFDASEYYAVGAMEYKFTVSTADGAPNKLRIVYPDGLTTSFDRKRATIETKDGYEVWTLTLTLPAGEYKVLARFGKDWEKNDKGFEVAYAKYNKDVTFVVNGEGSNAEVSVGELVKFTVSVPNDGLKKIRIYYENTGVYSTYDIADGTVNGDNVEFNIYRIYRKAGTDSIRLDVKTESGWTSTVANVTVTCA